jgi:hypothetical protein
LRRLLLLHLLHLRLLLRQLLFHLLHLGRLVFGLVLCLLFVCPLLLLVVVDGAGRPGHNGRRGRRADQPAPPNSSSHHHNLRKAPLSGIGCARQPGKGSPEAFIKLLN